MKPEAMNTKYTSPASVYIKHALVAAINSTKQGDMINHEKLNQVWGEVRRDATGKVSSKDADFYHDLLNELSAEGHIEKGYNGEYRRTGSASLVLPLINN